MSTALDEIKREIEELKKKVALAEEERNKVIAQADENLARAKKELEEFVAEVAATLGLRVHSERGAKIRSAHVRRRFVLEMLEAGKGEEEIAASLGVPLDLVQTDIAAIKKRTPSPENPEKTSDDASKDDGNDGDNGDDEADDEDVGVVESREATAGRTNRTLRQPPEANEHGWKRRRVLEMYREGKTRGEIAEELDVSRDCVGSHITALRSQGLLPDPSEASKNGDISASEKDADDGRAYEGDSIIDLRAEVGRQQAGQRTKAARLDTTACLSHTHNVLVDRMGDGVAQKGEYDHEHKVYRFVVGRAKDHTHDLKIPSGE